MEQQCLRQSKGADNFYLTAVWPARAAIMSAAPCWKGMAGVLAAWYL